MWKIHNKRILVAWALLGTGFAVALRARSGAPEELVEVVVADATADLESSYHFPVELNERVILWMERFTSERRYGFEQLLARRAHFADMLEGKLRERSMPQELQFLAMIESGFLIQAESHASAVGMWQFTGPTAAAYGLRVDDWVDERRDPERATDAALDYLERLHARFGSWYLAAAAYNAGPTRVARTLERFAGAQVAEEELYWEIAQYLPRETRDHVAKLLAATLLVRQAERHGFEIPLPIPAQRLEVVWVPGGTHLKRVAESLDLPLSLLQEFNPRFTRGTTPPDGVMALRVPVGSSRRVVSAFGKRGGGVRADD